MKRKNKLAFCFTSSLIPHPSSLLSLVVLTKPSLKNQGFEFRD
ncbi:MAG TPA: hypothetical protein VKB86_22975 [Pyrinomonadaceae bacterium]|nr:hypothetical protein [Pyrinomonadaceae bacterium]